MVIGGLKFARHSPIGIDLGEHSIKAAQLHQVGKGWALYAAVGFPRKTAGAPLDEEEINRLHGVLERGGFKGRAAVLAVPRSHLMSGMLELPPRAPGVPFDQIARMEFSRVNKCDPAGFGLSYWDLPDPARASKATHVMAMGYSHAAAEKYLELVEVDGLDVVALDTAASALTRACAPLATEGTTAILDIGYSEASLALSQGGTLTYERRMVEAGTRRLHEALQKQLDLNEEELAHVVCEGGLGEPEERRGAEVFSDARRAIVGHFSPLVHELRLTFSYTEHQYPKAPVKLMLLTGGGAAIPGLASHLNGLFRMDVRVAGPGDVMECSAGALERATPGLMTAVGLAQFVEG